MTSHTENRAADSENPLDALFLALDGIPADGLPTRVLGIHDDGRERWIQVARGDDASHSVVLRVSRFASLRHACAALNQWDQRPYSHAPRIIPVMCLASNAPDGVRSGFGDTAV